MRITIDIDDRSVTQTTAPGDAEHTKAVTDATSPENGGAGPDADGTQTTGAETHVDSGGPPQWLLDEISAAEKAGDAASATEQTDHIADAGAAPDSL